MRTMKIVCLLLSLCALAALTPAQTSRKFTDSRLAAREKARHTDDRSAYLKTELADCTDRIAEYQDKLVNVTAEIVAVDVRQRITLYDARTKKALTVSIAGLPKAQRRALLLSPVRRASVYGRVEKLNGQIMLNAHLITPIPAELPGEEPVQNN